MEAHDFPITFNLLFHNFHKNERINQNFDKSNKIGEKRLIRCALILIVEKIAFIKRAITEYKGKSEKKKQKTVS